MAPEKSFVLKRGEGLHDGSMIKHKVLDVETSRSSSAGSTPKQAPLLVPKSSYISPMQRVRQAKKRREQGGHRSKDWDMDSSTGSESTLDQSSVGTPSPLKPLPSAHSGNLIPKSGNLIPSSGYIPKARESDVSDNKHLPKFGVWDNQNDAADPCYTLLFENLAQEKRIGGPIRVHASNRSASPAPSEDLYNYNVPGAKKNKPQLHHIRLLCCFVGS